MKKIYKIVVENRYSVIIFIVLLSIALNVCYQLGKNIGEVMFFLGL